MNRPAEQRGHPQVQSDVAQARDVLHDHVQKLENQPEPLSDAQKKELADAKATLSRLPAEKPASTPESNRRPESANRPQAEAPEGAPRPHGEVDADAPPAAVDPNRAPHTDPDAEAPHSRGDSDQRTHPAETQPDGEQPTRTLPGDAALPHRYGSTPTPPSSRNSPDGRSLEPSYPSPARNSSPAINATDTTPYHPATSADSQPATNSQLAGRTANGNTPDQPQNAAANPGARPTDNSRPPSPNTPGILPAPTASGSPSSSPSRTSLPPPRTPPLSLNQSQRLLDNVSKMSPEARQHPQVQADEAQARDVVAGEVTQKSSSQNTPNLRAPHHALHSEQGQESFHGPHQQNAGSWQKANDKAETTIPPLTKEQWAARSEFKPDPNPVKAADLITWKPDHPVSAEMQKNIISGAQGLFDLLPRHIAETLSPVRLNVVKSLGGNVIGKYDPNSNTLILSHDQIHNFSPEQVRKTMWHETGHWLYHQAGDANAHESLKKWRSAIEEHWNKRTKGKSKEWNEDKTWQYINGDWISDYAGRFYGQVGGLELPSVYLEAASWGPGRLAKLANKFSRSQETFEIILSILKK